MKRILLGFLAMAIVVFGTLAYAESDSKVLLIPREGSSGDLELMLTKEVGVMTSMLKEAGFEVVVATVTGQPIVAYTTTLKPDLKLANVKVANYVGFILPCMAVGLFPGPPVAPEAIAIVKQAVAEGKIVAAQLGSVIILAEAGVLKGKRYAFVSDPLKTTSRRKVTDSRFEGAIYSGRNVVRDINIITSGVCPFIEQMFGLPDQTPQLIQTSIAVLKKK